MPQALTRRTRRRCLLLHNVDWMTYRRLSRALAEQPGVRLAYDNGALEIMSPSLYHDRNSRFLVVMVMVLTQEFGLPINFGGSTTLKRRLRRKGVEADECFWIANAAKVGGKRRLDLRFDPPPDLAIEVDVSNSSLDHFAIYAALKVPEVWRWEEETLLFHVLNEAGAYDAAETSLSVPGIRAVDLLPFLKKAQEAADENEVEREFRAWVRQARRL